MPREKVIRILKKETITIINQLISGRGPGHSSLSANGGTRHSSLKY